MENVILKLSEGYEIITSGSVITIPNIPLSFIIDGMEFIFNFNNDVDTIGKQHANVKVVGNNKLSFVLTNYNNSLGIGNTELLSLGKLKGRELLMAYRIYALNSEIGKLFFYTFYARSLND